MSLQIGKSSGGSFTDLLKDGYQHLQGLDEAVYSNIKACNELTSMTRTSMGPNARNKIVINHLEKMFLTSDTATILSELEVVHPAAKLLLLAAKQQQAQFGDQTNFLLALAGSLLEQAECLLRTGVKVADVIQGYELTLQKVLSEIPALVVDTVKDWGSEKDVAKVVYAAVCTKQQGLESVLVPLVVKACISAMPQDVSKFSVDFLRTVKIAGGSLADSFTLEGMVFEREPETTLKEINTPVKVAVYSTAIDIASTETKGTVLLENAQQVLDFSKGEEAGCEAIMRALSEAGFKVLVTGGTVGDMMLHFANRYNMIVLKVLSKFDLRRLCAAIGAKALATFGAVFPTDEEAGSASSVQVVEIGGSRCTIMRSPNSATVSMVLRSSTQASMDDIERAIESGISAVRACTRNPDLLAGAGAFEMEVSRLLESYARGIPGVAQYAVEAASKAFRIVPQVLAENAVGAAGSQALVGELLRRHVREGEVQAGIFEDGRIANAAEEGVFDLEAAKKSAIELAFDAALTVLRIDQIIMSRLAGGPKPRAVSNQQDD